MIYYDIQTKEYLKRAILLIARANETQDGALRFYAALELRTGIERYFLEVWYFWGRENVPERLFASSYSPKLIGQKILEIEPDFAKKIQYVNLYLEACDVPQRMVVPDFSLLNKVYGRLGSFLHAPSYRDKTILDENWWRSVQSSLRDGEQCLSALLKGTLARISLETEKTKRHFEDWKSGTISDAEAVDNMRADRSGSSRRLDE